MASTVWRGTIAFGLVSIPVRLVRAARRERIRFHQVVREPGARDDPGDGENDPGLETDSRPVQRVHHTLTASLEPTATASLEPTAGPRGSEIPASRPVPPAEILKGLEVEPDRYVTFKPAEMKALKAETSTSIEIDSFLHAAEIDPVYFDASYYIVPRPAGEKPYSLLFASLSRTKYAALGQMAMHGREHAILIRPGEKGLLLDTLFFQNEIHLEDQYAADPKLASVPELKMAESFIEALAAKFNPALLVDQQEMRLKALIEKRNSSPVAGPAAEERSAAPVVDILEALRKSLEQVRKPAAKETQTTGSRAQKPRQKARKAS